MFAQSTKHNRLDDGNSGKTRDRSAPMDFAFEKPRDPGVFGVVPHKRESSLRILGVFAPHAALDRTTH